MITMEYISATHMKELKTNFITKYMQILCMAADGLQV